MWQHVLGDLEEGLAGPVPVAPEVQPDIAGIAGAGAAQAAPTGEPVVAIAKEAGAPPQ